MEGHKESKEKNSNEPHTHEHHEVSSAPITHTHSSSKSNAWMVISIILIIAVIVLLVLLIMNGGIGKNINSTDASKKLVDYLNGKTGGGVEYVSVADKGKIYEVTVSYQSQNIPVYITKDGEYFIQGAIAIKEDATDNSTTNTPTPQEVVKSDKPKAELFVMTHCPYGTQAEKGFIPAIKALGAKADTKIRFVHYFMHGDKEEQETYNQVCIREEQSSKYLTYLECFLATDGSVTGPESCLTKAGIDKTKLNACLANNATKAKEYYAVDKQLSEQYGVQGSPTLILNGAEANSGRSADAFFKTICSAFNTAPSDCNTKTLSTTNPGAGFGTGTSGSASTASCG